MYNPISFDKKIEDFTFSNFIETGSRRTSLSPRNNSPTKLELLNLISIEEVKNAPDFELLGGKENCLQSDSYFFNPTDVILGQEGTRRPKKFKPICIKLKKNEKIIDLKKIKKVFEQKCLESSAKNLKNSLIEMMISYANEEKSFDTLPLSSINMPLELYNLLKTAYNTLLKKILNDRSQIQPYNIYDSKTLTEFYDFPNHDKACEKLSYYGERKEKLPIALWNSYKDVFASLMQTYWSVTPLATNLGPITIQEYLKQLSTSVSTERFNDKLITLLFRALQAEVLVAQDQNDDTNTLKEATFKVLNPMLVMLLVELKEKMIAHSPKGSGPFKKEFRDVCNSKDLEDYFITTSKTSEELNYFCLTSLIKEQKQHSIARFYNLVNYYTAFSNTIHLLSLQGQKRGMERRLIVSVVDKILEYAHIEENRQREPDAELEKLATINFQHHRENYIMGYEKDKLCPVDLDHKIALLNLFTNTWNSDSFIQKMERAHTLPFPSCFSWKKEKIQEFINEIFGKPHYMKNSHDPLYFKREIFEHIAQKGLDHKQIEKVFQDKINSYSQFYENDKEFLLSSLELIKKFYLRLFSETELLPDFMNEELDTISEWRLEKQDADNASTYKQQLATSLREMIQQDKFLEKSNVASYLKPYFDKTTDKMVKTHTKYYPGRGDNFTTINLMKLVCLYQVEEGMRVALYNNKKSSIFGTQDSICLVDDIFTKCLTTKIVASEELTNTAHDLFL